MYEPEHFVDLQDNSGNFGDGNSWLSAHQQHDQSNNSSPSRRPTHSQFAPSASGNVDRVLFNDLVEMVPLVQSLIDRNVSSSFTRRGSVIYTKTPSRESISKKMIDPRGRNSSQSIATKKKKDPEDKDQLKSAGSKQDANTLIVSSRTLATEKDAEESLALREQVEDLKKKLLEKDEQLKSSELSKNQMNAVYAKMDELKLQVAEKDSLIRSTQLRLSNAKIKLADKQAALEKLQWETTTSNQKVGELREEIDSIKGGISSFMLLFESLMKNDLASYAEDYDIKPFHLDQLPDIDDDDMEMQKMEEAREAYTVAVAAAREKQDEESIAGAATARLRLQSFVFRSNNMNEGKGFLQL